MTESLFCSSLWETTSGLQWQRLQIHEYGSGQLNEVILLLYRYFTWQMAAVTLDKE